MWMDYVLPIGTKPQVLRQVRGEGPLIGQLSIFSDIANNAEFFPDPYGDIYYCGCQDFSVKRVNSNYKQSYDYTLEKVKSYIRLSLKDIIQVTKGRFFLASSHHVLNVS